MYPSHTKTVFSSIQLDKLQSVFDQDCTPSTNVKRYLAKDLGLKPKAVQVWFNNRACRGKKRGENLISRNVSCISMLKYTPAKLQSMDFEKEVRSSSTPKFKQGVNEGLKKSFKMVVDNNEHMHQLNYQINRMETPEFIQLKQQAINNLFGLDPFVPISRSYHPIREQDMYNLNFMQKIFNTKN